MNADASMSLGVIVERREVENPWQDFAWRPIAVVPNAARGGRRPLEVKKKKRPAKET